MTIKIETSFKAKIDSKLGCKLSLFKNLNSALSALLGSMLCFSASLQAQDLAASEPLSYTTLCTKDENCSVSRASIVGYGNEQNKIYRTLAGAFICNAASFGLSEDSSNHSSSKAESSAAVDAEPYCFTPNTGAAQTSAQSAASLNAPSNLDWLYPLVEDGVKFAIVSMASGKALTRMADSDDELVVVQSDFNQGDNQLWTFKPLDSGYYAITSSDEEVAIGLDGWSRDEGTELRAKDWINSWHQQWSLHSSENHLAVISSRFSGKVIDVYEMNNFDQGAVRAWTYWGGENQLWLILPLFEATSK